MQITEIQIYSTSALVYIDYKPEFLINQKVVIDINGNLEMGIIKRFVENFDTDVFKFVRFATEEDEKLRCENCHYSRSLLPEIKKEANKLGLDMKIGFISTSLDQSKIYVNYTAEDRVDFRELLKVLSSKYKSRIEMKQIGNRDEAKQVGALGTCGRITCCKAFLSDFDKVSIKMAKNQNMALNPNKINGMCGRLLCCLKYEDEFYEEMQTKMPKIGFKVTTPDGVGTVVSTDFLKETVSVNFTKDDTSEIKVYNLSNISFSRDKK